MNRFTLAFGFCLAAASPALAADDAGTCLWANQVDGFGTATRESIVLTAGTRNWLATFANPCAEIERAMSVAVEATGTCVGKGDSVVFRLPGGMSQRCMISGIAPADSSTGK
jgi:hypothetical protein